MGCPIRVPADQFVFANPHSFSQLVTPFFASGSLGILRTPFVTFFLREPLCRFFCSLLSVSYLLSIVCYLYNLYFPSCQRTPINKSWIRKPKIYSSADNQGIEPYHVDDTSLICLCLKLNYRVILCYFKPLSIFHFERFAFLSVAALFLSSALLIRCFQTIFLYFVCFAEVSQTESGE